MVWGAFFARDGTHRLGPVAHGRSTRPDKAYLLVSWLFLISSMFTLAKTLRDAHEAALLEARLAGRREAAQQP